MSASMEDVVSNFEAECIRAGVAPAAALEAGGLHRSTWFRWKANNSSPTLRNLQAAQAGLAKLVADRPAEKGQAAA